MNVLADDSNNIVCISNKIYFHKTCVLYQQQANLNRMHKEQLSTVL
ncbi:hypothetical protein [Nostoc sp. CCY 9925]